MGARDDAHGALSNRPQLEVTFTLNQYNPRARMLLDVRDTTERGARVRFPPPLVFLSALLGGIAMHHFVAPASVPLGRTLGAAAGGLVVVVGVAVIVSARIWFTRSGQSPTPWTPTPSLIFQGPYRFTRNPMYLGATTILLGLGLALGNLWIDVLAPVALGVVHVIAVLPEEQYLSEKFGDGYTQYRARVRRYL
jgi:protein-S-isoprenylcysteine O-methyltransferase Ste14